MIRTLVGILLCFLTINLFSVDEISTDEWKKASEKYDYTESFKEIEPKPPKEKLEEAKQKTVPKDQGFFKAYFKVFLLVLLGLVLTVLVVMMVLNMKGISLSHRVKKEDSLVVMDDPDEYTETDLERLLREAETDRNYRLALRIRFLMLIKQLNEKNVITWRKEKTNIDYLFEINKQEIRDPFRYLVGVFEKVWYASYLIDEHGYESIAKRFESLKQNMET